MGSTMACYKYTHRGFSTLNNTPTHDLLRKHTLHVEMKVQDPVVITGIELSCNIT